MGTVTKTRGFIFILGDRSYKKTRLRKVSCPANTEPALRNICSVYLVDMHDKDEANHEG